MLVKGAPGSNSGVSNSGCSSGGGGGGGGGGGSSSSGSSDSGSSSQLFDILKLAQRTHGATTTSL